MQRIGTSFLNVMGSSRESGEQFLSRHIFPNGSKSVLTCGGVERSNVLGEVEFIDDNSKETNFDLNITFVGDFDRIDRLVELSVNYPDLEFWIQIWDFENLTPAGLCPDFNFRRGVITERNLGDQLVSDSDS